MQVKEHAVHLEHERAERSRREDKVRELERTVAMLRGSVEVEAKRNIVLKQQLQM